MQLWVRQGMQTVIMQRQQLACLMLCSCSKPRRVKVAGLPKLCPQLGQHPPCIALGNVAQYISAAGSSSRSAMHIKIDVQLEPGEIDLATELLSTLRCAGCILQSELCRVLMAPWTGGPEHA